MYDKTSQNRAGVAKHRYKIWDENLGQMDGQTDTTRYRGALQLKMKDIYKLDDTIFWCTLIQICVSLDLPI
jgi:hypothetical protein